MRLREISPVQHRLLEQLASGISTRLEAQFVELADRDDAHIGVMLKEASRQVVIELPVAMLTEADDLAGREQLRTRVKARRDRMMFKTPPPPLPKNVAPLFHPGPPRGGGFRGGRR
jgi:hypothetical protein